MKKLVSLMITILMLGLLATTSWAVTGEIAVTQVLGSSNTAPTGPVSFLIDGNPGTSWNTNDPSTGPAWAVLQLKEMVMIDGLQLYGAYTGKLTVEYWQNNGWHSFLAAHSMTGTNRSYGWNPIDLSYDRIATDRIRLYLTTDQATKLGGIGEVKVFGRSAANILQRIEPVSVSTSTRTQYGYPSSYLFDHNTYTEWRVYAGWPTEAESIADLGGNCSVQRIKVYTIASGSSNQYQGQLKIQYQSNNNWYDIPGVNIDLRRMTTGWQSFDLSGSAIKTAKLRVVLNGTQIMGGIKEVEIWGYRSAVSGSSYFFGGEAEVALSADTSANYLLNVSDASSGTFNLHVTGNGTASNLTWELNGWPMGNLTPSSVKDGTVFYHVPVDIHRLVTGDNYVRINGAGLTVTDCRIEKTTAFYLDGSDSELNDRWLLTPVSGNESLIDLGGNFHLDQIVLQYIGSQPTVQIAVLQDGQWVTVSGPSANSTDSLGGQLVYSGIGKASQIRVHNDSNPSGNGPTELMIYGSGINEGVPKIKITSPLDGNVFTLSQWGQGSFCASLDNPDVTLKLNGQVTYFTGTEIKLPLPQLGTPQGEQVIKAEVTDSQGRTGSDTITISVSTPPDFTVNLPEGITYTSDSQITVSGVVIIPTSQITINGEAVNVQNNKFSTVYPLKQGLNLLTIRLIPRAGSTQVNTLVRKVVRTTGGPSLKVLYPVDSQVTNAAQISVSGAVNSLLPIKVTINGKAATVNSGSFTSDPISLTEGPNKLTVIVTDKNGLTSQAILIVYRDSAKPVLNTITPADGAYLKSLVVTVTGIISDASAVSVLVNGVAASVNNKQFSATVTLNEGPNTINIQATDSAGNVTNLSRNVFIDTGAPAAFTPTANPSGWTNNNKPSITFNTTDSGSGIDHYEIGVDGGTTSGKITSPYTFTTAIADGEHTVQVKAVDRAGNSTIGEVKVYIDTAPPTTPANFEAIPGIGRVILNWEDNGGEVKGYRITRGTPFSGGGSYVELFRASDNQEVAQYVDNDVTSGSSYTYTVQAIDRAGNYSAATVKLTAAAGKTTQTIDNQGGTVKFDDCTLTLPAGAITTSGQVVMKKTDETLPDNNYGTKVGRAYSFSMVDSSGKEVEAKFNDLVTLTVSYADMTIPDGYDKGDLGVYWYNKASGCWEKLDYDYNDIDGKTITVKLHHFSDYQVMASKYNSPSLDSYYNMGVSPSQSYFQNNVESVSPSSGTLTISSTDLKLPGRCGFDLVIKRIYDSNQAINERYMASNVDKSYSSNIPIDMFGCGWSLAIPWIEVSNKGNHIRLPEGQTIKIELNSSGVFEYHAGVHFILQKNSATGGYSLSMNDGTKYEIDSKNRVSTKIDPSGKNVINYNYNPSNGRQIATITDSVGHVVTFHYTSAGTKAVIDSIITGEDIDNIRKITYEYKNGDDALTGVNGPWNPNKDSTKLTTRYTYQTRTIKGGYTNRSTDYVDKTFNYTVDLLNTITYPTGETSTYGYAFGDQDYKEEITKKIWGVFERTVQTIKYYGKKVLISNHSVAGKETVYSYGMNGQTGSYKQSNFVPAYTYMISCQVTEGNRINQMNFKPMENSSLVDEVGNIENYQGSLMIQNQIFINNSQLVEKVSLQYDVPLQAITGESHYRGGNQVFSIHRNYDGWGNLTYQYDESCNLEQTWEYYSPDTSAIKNLVYRQKQINKNPIKNTTIAVSTTYTYNSLGKPATMIVNNGKKDLETDFLKYDEYGNLLIKIDKYNHSLETDFTFDDRQLFVKEKKIKGVLDADGNGSDIITYVDYNWETGTKTSETDARGYVTRYEYDSLNRVTRVFLPNDNNDTNNLYRKYDYDDIKRTCVFTNEKGQKTTYQYDGLGRLTEVIKDTSLYSGGVKESYHYNNLGQIDQVTDPRGNTTSYTYDGLNRVTKVNYPGGAYVTIRYDDDTNTVTITDENGGIISEQKDWADRLVLAKQYCSYNGVTDIYSWSYFYDSLGHKLRQTDPKSNRTDQEYDALGHLTSVLMPSVPVILPGSPTTKDYQPKLSYEYNDAGLKMAETRANENAIGSGNNISYEYDQLGRVIKTTTQATDIFTNKLVSMVTKTYYDEAGNKKEIIDPNGEKIQYTYSARGYLLTQTDQAGNVTRYQYDVLGNKTDVTDPRGNGTDGTFTTQYKYDDLNRLVKTILPNQTYTETTYDQAGNKLTERDPNGVITSYTYTVRNWVETASQNGQLKMKYVYDAKGNQIETYDALNNVTKKEYDSLGRVRKEIQQGTSTVIVEYTYDALGNRIVVKDGRNNRTINTYNGLGWLTSVTDPLTNTTQYYYDPNGNQVKVITAKGLTLQNRYDELNRVTESIDSLNHSIKYSYDLAGNRQQIMDRRGTTWTYQYTPNNLLKRLDLAGVDGTSYYVEYTYDAAGNREQVTDSGNTVQYNFVDGIYQADPMNRLNSVGRSFDGATYRTAYQYDNAGLLTKIKYPEATDWLQYSYNNLNQLSEVKGFTSGISYDANGALTGLTYANGAISSYGYDNNNRLKEYQVTLNGTSILQQSFTYDNNNNITAITEGINTKTFDYDANNQLSRSVTPGKFLEGDPSPGTYGIKIGDYLGAKYMDFTPVLTAMMGLDYNSSSIGIDLGTSASGVKKIQVIPDGKFTVHRVNQRSLDLYTSSDNSIYTIIPRSNWTFVTDSKGVITITLAQRIATRYLKVHVKFDERDTSFKAKSKATFLNDFAKMLRVYQESTSRTEEFQYDEDGNRKYQRVTLIQAKSYSSAYYTNADQLKTDGKYAFVYDEAGNLVKKGNKFTINGDNVTFTATSGDGVEYWQYTYDLLNRLTEVSKNGTVVSDYEYSPDGLREVKKGSSGTIHYVFEGTEPIFEKRMKDGKIKSYVYALGKHLARVDGVIGDTAAKVYYYHTDYLGSVRAITDQTGKVVFNADYFAFGTKFIRNGDFDETHGFTGKDYDSDTGMYYYNARWYDSDLGRFISEDPAVDPNNPNLYSYCGNNPVGRIDPSGQFWEYVIYVIASYVFSCKRNADDTSDRGGHYFAGWSGTASVGVNINTGNGESPTVTPIDYTSPEGTVGDIQSPSGLDYSNGYDTGSNEFLNEASSDPYHLKEPDYLESYQLPKPEDYRPSTDPLGTRGMPNGLVYAPGVSRITAGKGLVRVNLPSSDKGVISLLEPYTAEQFNELMDDPRVQKMNVYINSMFRITEHQRDLYNDYLNGKMQYTVAPPHTSPHEAGLAFDIDVNKLGANFEMFKQIAKEYGFYWQGSSDPVHFGMRFQDAGYTSMNQAINRKQAVYKNQYSGK
jgi:RHS repeat-associated protein